MSAPVPAVSPATPPAELPHLHHQTQTLLLDADDTLWENNVYFEDAIASFISFLDHQVHSPAVVREHLNRIEQATVVERGYGLQSFRHSLLTCFEELSAAAPTPEHHQALAGFADLISTRKIDLLDGVAATLAQLSRRHRLLLVTKGDSGEQQDKLARSSLAPFFSAVEVLAEKNAAAYRELTSRHQCPPATSWMIGNSPRSDINPALAAGLHAVFVPHRHTWVLEHETLDPAPAGQRLLTIERFSDLLTIF